MATTTVAVGTMKVAQVSRPGADFEIIEREIPKPGAGEVRIKVQACGVCHSDAFTKEGAWPGIQYPRVPGHEVAGIIDEVGAGVSAWKKGQRVGVGWHGGRDGTCLWCRRGDFRNCRTLKIPGISYDGGYQQHMLAPAEALAVIPETLADVEAAPLLCAGITTFDVSETTCCLCSLLNTNFLVATKRLTRGEESTGTRCHHLLLPIQCNNALRT